MVCRTTLGCVLRPLYGCMCVQDILDLLRLDPTDHMWYCLYCEESIPSAPLRCVQAVALFFHIHHVTRQGATEVAADRIWPSAVAGAAQANDHHRVKQLLDFAITFCPCASSILQDV